MRLWTRFPLTISLAAYARLSISIEAQPKMPATPLPLVRVAELADGTTRTDVVLGASGLDPTKAHTLVDIDPPYGVSKVASLAYRFGEDALRVTPLDEPREVLSEPISGRSTWMWGTEVGDATFRSATKASWEHIHAAGLPYVNARPEQAATEELSLYTATMAELRAVNALLAARTPLLLRSSVPGIDDRWFVVEGDRKVTRVQPKRAADPWRLHTWETIPTGRPDPASLDALASTLGTGSLADPGGTQSSSGVPTVAMGGESGVVLG